MHDECFHVMNAFHHLTPLRSRLTFSGSVEEPMRVFTASVFRCSVTLSPTGIVKYMSDCMKESLWVRGSRGKREKKERVCVCVCARACELLT